MRAAAGYAISCSEASWATYTLDIQAATGEPTILSENPLRTLAKEDACLTNNPQDLGFVGDPVNTFSGNFTHSVEDVLVPAQGLPLRFERTYNSLDADTDGSLGYGWTHSYDMSLAFDGDTVTLKAPRGSRLTFTDNGDGTYTPGPGIRSTLEPQANGYRLTRADQMVYTFDEQGRLTALQDHNGNQTTLTYDASGLLERVTAAGGDSQPRALELTYNAQGYVATLSAGGQMTVTYSYYVAGDLASVTDRRGFSTQYTYEHPINSDLHLLRELTDPNGNSLTLSYDNQGRVLSQTAGLDNTFVYAYGAGATTVTGPRNHDTTYHYEDGLLTSIVDPLNQWTSFAYDEAFNRTRITDTLRHVTSLEWNPGACKVSAITDTLGHVSAFAYDAHNNLTSQTDPLGRTARYAYDEHDNLTTITDTLGNVSRLDYDAYGQLLQTTNAQGYTTTFAYNAHGDLISVQDALSYTASFEHDPLTGEVIEARDAGGYVTRFEYDAGGNLLATTDPLNGVVRFDYGPAGELLVVTDQRGYTTTYTYDELYQVTAVSDALGGQTSFEYDAAGNLTRVTDPNSHSTSFTYDALGRPTEVTDPLNHSTRYDYDPMGKLTHVTDPNDHTTIYDYDDLNRLTRVVDALNGTTQYQYDVVGNLTQVTNARGHSTSYAYDDLNRLVSVTDPLTHTWTYTYNSVSSLVSTRDANGVTVNYGYDALGRLTGIDYPASQGDVSFTYDARGNRASMVDPSGATTYVYDALSRLTSAVHPDNQTVSYDYDAAGNREQLTYPNGAQVNYTYDALNRLEQVSSPDWPQVSALYTYDSAGRLVERRDAENSAIVAYAYDDANRLLSLAYSDDGSTTASFAYAYDAAGNRIQAMETLLTETVTITYSYDELYRLASAAYSSGEAYTYTYDAVGNRLNELSHQGALTYTYDVADRLTRVDTDGSLYTTYQHDANGNLTYQRTFGLPGLWPRDGQYHYDAANRLTQVTRRNSSTGQFDELAAFEYNGDGLRVSQTANGHVTSYVWDVAAGMPQVLMEGPYAYSYGHTALNRIALVPGLSLDYVQDGLGSVRLTVDSISGQVVDSYRYTPFGKVLTGSSSDNTQGFTGESYDPTTGLIYLRARYYDPALGRFLTQDPFPGFAAAPGTQHPYAYVGSNPVNYVDPSGHLAFLGTAAIGGFIGGVVGGVSYALTTDNFSWGGLGKSALKGAASGTVAGATGFVIGGALSGLTGLFGAVVGGGASGAAASGAGQIVDNLLTPCVSWSDGLGQAMLFGGLIGGVTGGVGYGVRQWLSQSSTIPASRIRFTQDTIGPNTKAGVPLDVLTQEIDNGYFRGTLKVVKIGNKFYSLDNRRLAAFKLLNRDVPVTLVNFKNPRILKEFTRKFTTINDGVSILVRGTELIIK